MASKDQKNKEIKGRVSYEMGRRFDGVCYAAECTMQDGVKQAIEMWVEWAEQKYGKVKIETPAPPAARRAGGK